MKNILNKIYLTLIFIFLYAPILILIIFSFNNSKLSGTWVGFTFKWYDELIKNSEIMESLYNTILIATVATCVATIFGTISGVGIYFLKKSKRNLILMINNFPVLNPDIVTAVSLIGLYGLFKLKFGYTTLILSHIVLCTPYVILSILPRLNQMDSNIVEAAMDLGATPSYTLKKVIVPQIMPGIITGALTAFTLSLDDFVISYLTAGNGISTLSISIYSMARMGINPAINALSTIMLLVLFILLIIINKRTSKTGNKLIPLLK